MTAAIAVLAVSIADPPPIAIIPSKLLLLKSIAHWQLSKVGLLTISLKIFLSSNMLNNSFRLIFPVDVTTNGL